MNETDETHPMDGIEFRGQAVQPAGRSKAVGVGIVAGSALLFVVGAVAAMGASPAPATGTDPTASSVPGAAGTPGMVTPDGDRPGWGGPMAGLGRGGHGDFGGFGFHDIAISAISGSDLSLKTEDGWTRTITIASTTAITKGGATIAIGDLAVGDQVHFTQDKAADGTYTVTAVNVVLPSVVGQVTAVDGDTLTVTQPGGTSAKIHVDGKTTYRVDGAAGTKAAVKVGSWVLAEGSQRSDGSLDAVAVRTGLGGRGGSMGRGFPGFPGGPQAPAASPAPSTSAS